MGGKIKQRVYIKFCVKISKSATEILEMLRGAILRTFFQPDSGR
jgi:hypothetical protein